MGQDKGSLIKKKPKEHVWKKRRMYPLTLSADDV